ncbi:hypothetical protein [uncultured Ezakiella sp.]|uniref:hypothetical protein n=1 Tax=uncultured Ezakiella sp. TaxID=1637529 RepID=UPI0025EF3553|nr:hypothetical protein [uncultured Ezakiella sp.]
MKRVLVIALAILMVLAPIARAEGQGDVKAEAVKSFQPFKLDGKEVKIGGYLINANNYYKLRDLAALLNGTGKEFNVIFDNEKKQIGLELGKPYEKLDTDLQEMKHEKTTAKMVTNTILVDGKEVELKAALIDRNNYVKLRDIGAVVGFLVDYDKETKAIVVDTKSEAKAEEKVEEKAEEKKEEKLEEKKEEVKNADPNATAEEIQAFLADGEKVKNLSINGYNLKKDGDVYYISKKTDKGEGKLPIIKYQLMDKDLNKKRIEAQSAILGEGKAFELSWEKFFNTYFIKADRLGQNSIDILSLVNDFAYKMDQENKFGIDIKNGHLVAPLTNGTSGRLGTVIVVANYSDGSKIESNEGQGISEIPLVKDGAKLTSCHVMVYLSDEMQHFAFVYII